MFNKNQNIMKKISFSTKNYNVEESGIVRHKITGEILTCLGHPSRRQRFRLWIKSFKRSLEELGKAAAYSIKR
jgi:transcriptional regulator of NAD metabolism